MSNLGKTTTNFARGLNQQASQTIGQNECSVAENYVFKDRSATVREGIKVYGSLPSPVVTIKKFYNKDGGNYFCAIAGGQFYNSVTSGTFTSVSTATVVSGTIDSEVYAGAMYFTDYSSPVKYFDGNIVDVAGLSSPIFRKQINDFEDVSQWTVNLQGSITEDRHYTHIDHGNKAILFSASSPSIAAVFSIGGGTEIISNVKNGVNFNLSSPIKNICRDLSGNINIFYTTSAPYDDVYLAKSVNQGSSWTTTQITSSVGTYRKYMPSCAVDSSNNIHLVYFGTNSSYPNMDSAFYTRYHENSGYIETYLTSAFTSNDSPTIRVAVNSSNDAHIIFNKNYPIDVGYVVNNYSNIISSVSSINGSSATAPCIAIDRSNIVHMVWTGVMSGFVYGLVYKKSTNSNTSTLTPYMDGSIAPYIPFADMAIDSSSNIHIVYAAAYNQDNARNIKYIKYNNATDTWLSGILLTTETGTKKLNQFYPQLSIDQNNKINVFWKGLSDNNPSYTQIRYTSYLSGWSPVVDLTNTARQQGNPSPIWSYHPVASSARCNIAKTGWVFSWYDEDYLKYHASLDLTWTSSKTTPMSYNLNTFASDVSSDLKDIIQVYTCHDKKQNISSIQIQFIDSNSYTATAEICNLSSWQSCSNDQWGLTHNIPKSTMQLSNTSFNWGSCNLQINMTAVSSNPQNVAKCAIDNLRMTKTPPIIDYSISTPAKSNLLFFGSAAVAGLQSTVEVPSPTIPGISGYDGDGNPIYTEVTNPLYQQYLDGTYIPPAPTLDTMGELQLEGLKMLGDPLPSGTYYYKTTFLKESPSGLEIESTPSFQTSGYVVSNATSSWTYVHLTNIPIAPDSMGVVGRRIYRRRADENFYRMVYTIGDNSVTNFLDTVPNYTLGKGLEDDHTPPPQAKLITRASNQIIYYANIIEQGIAYPSRIRFSLPYEPYYCPIANTVDFSSDDGQEITGQFEFNGIIHVLKNRTTWTLSKGVPQNIHTTLGCIAPKSVAVGRSEAFWLSEEGIIKYRLYQFQNISHSNDKSSIYRIQTILDRLPKEFLSNARGIYYNGYYLLAVTDAGSDTNNIVLCYDVDNDVWSVFPNLNVNCWDAWLGGQDGYRLFFGNNSGLVCEFFSGNYDISTPIYSSIQSKDFGVPTPQEHPRKAYLFLKDLDGMSKTINVTPIYDFVSNSGYPGQYPLTLSSGENNLQKIDLPMNDPPSFFGMRIEGSGRFKIQQLDIYGKQEKLR